MLARNKRKAGYSEGSLKRPLVTKAEDQPHSGFHCVLLRRGSEGLRPHRATKNGTAASGAHHLVTGCLCHGNLHLTISNQRTRRHEQTPSRRSACGRLLKPGFGWFRKGAGQPALYRLSHSVVGPTAPSLSASGKCVGWMEPWLSRRSLLGAMPLLSEELGSWSLRRWPLASNTL